MILRGETRWRKVSALGCALVLALSGCGRSSGIVARAAASANYTLIQMNLCLSGLAACYAKVDYPAAVREASARIRALHPDAVTLNEVCRGDIALIARQTGYHPRFSSVTYYGRPLPCIRPGGRGVFGDAVLTRSAIGSASTQGFTSQEGPERRVWLCVSTRGPEICTAHLASHEPDEAAANSPQCAELREVIARQAVGRAVIFGGDVNRRGSCAPQGFWTRTDSGAHQDPSNQHVYGSGWFRSPTARVLPTTHTDHDALLISAHL